MGADQHPDREDNPDQWKNTARQLNMFCEVLIILRRSDSTIYGHHATLYFTMAAVA